MSEEEKNPERSGRLDERERLQAVRLEELRAEIKKGLDRDHCTIL